MIDYPSVRLVEQVRISTLQSDIILYKLDILQ